MAWSTAFGKLPLRSKVDEMARALYGDADGISSNSILHGVGTSTDPYTWSIAAKNGVTMYTESTATGGSDTRGLYWKHFLSGADGSGEAGRFFCQGGAASIDAMCGIHASAELDTVATSQVGGLACGVRATFGAGAATRVMTGTVCALMVESNVAAGNTLPSAQASFIRVVDSGTVTIPALFSLPAIASAGMVAAHTTQTNTHSLRILVDGVVYYIPIHATATGRTGGA